MMLLAEIISEKFLVVTSAIKITPITNNQQVRENTQKVTNTASLKSKKFSAFNSKFNRHMP